MPISIHSAGSLAGIVRAVPLPFVAGAGKQNAKSNNVCMKHGLSLTSNRGRIIKRFVVYSALSTVLRSCYEMPYQSESSHLLPRIFYSIIFFKCILNNWVLAADGGDLEEKFKVKNWIFQPFLNFNLWGIMLQFRDNGMNKHYLHLSQTHLSLGLAEMERIFFPQQPSKSCALHCQLQRCW